MNDEKAAPGGGGHHENGGAGAPDSTGRNSVESRQDRLFLDSTDECLRGRLTPASYAGSAAASGLQLSAARIRIFGRYVPYLTEHGNGRYWFSAAVIARLAGFADSDTMFRSMGGVPRAESPGRGWRGVHDEPLFGELAALLYVGLRGPWDEAVADRFFECGWFEPHRPFDMERFGQSLDFGAGDDGQVPR